MVLQLLGLIAIVIFTIFVAKTAGENGRNAVTWGAACAVTGIGLQWVLPLALIFCLGVAMTVAGSSPEVTMATLTDWAMLITIGFLALSFAGMFLILRKVAQLPDESDLELADGPPPPPSFGQ